MTLIENSIRLMHFEEKLNWLKVCILFNSSTQWKHLFICIPSNLNRHNLKKKVIVWWCIYQNHQYSLGAYAAHNIFWFEQTFNSMPSFKFRTKYFKNILMNFVRCNSNTIDYSFRAKFHVLKVLILFFETIPMK